MRMRTDFARARRAAFYSSVQRYEQPYRPPLRLRLLRKLVWVFLPFVVVALVVVLLASCKRHDGEVCTASVPALVAERCVRAYDCWEVYWGEHCTEWALPAESGQ